MTTWEYLTIKQDISGFFTPKVDTTKFDEELTRLGREGWELVSCLDVNIGHGASYQLVAVFKRPTGTTPR